MFRYDVSRTLRIAVNTLREENVSSVIVEAVVYNVADDIRTRAVREFAMRAERKTKEFAETVLGPSLATDFDPMPQRPAKHAVRSASVERNADRNGTPDGWGDI